jgi:hypothetical protein
MSTLADVAAMLARTPLLTVVLCVTFGALTLEAWVVRAGRRAAPRETGGRK